MFFQFSVERTSEMNWTTIQTARHLISSSFQHFPPKHLAWFTKHVKLEKEKWQFFFHFISNRVPNIRKNAPQDTSQTSDQERTCRTHWVCYWRWWFQWLNDNNLQSRYNLLHLLCCVLVWSVLKEISWKWLIWLYEYKGFGSVTKKLPDATASIVLSTPQCAPQSSKTCGPVYTVEHDSATPTLPQGAAAERQRHLTKPDVSVLPRQPTWKQVVKSNVHLPGQEAVEHGGFLSIFFNIYPN